MVVCYGIVSFLDIINKKIEHIEAKNKKLQNIKKEKYVLINKIKKYLKQTLAVSISVQIVIMPIILYNYKSISLTFLITNILTSFIISIIIMLGFILIIISFPLFQIAKMLGEIYQIFLKLLLLITEITSQMPFSKIYLKTPFIYEIILYYFLIFLIRYLIKKNKLKKYKKKIILIILIIIIILKLILNIPDNKLKIYFIDVGQGDACLIITPKNKTILIDGGGGENYNIRRESINSVFIK